MTTDFPDAHARAPHEGLGVAQPKRKKRKAGKRRRDLFWILLGVVILLYPLVATLYNDWQLNNQAQKYSQDVESIKPPQLTEHYLQQAREYNAFLARQGHHARPARQGDEGFDRYMSTLNPPETGGVMARLRIPAIDVDLPVYHTTNSSVLYKGVGHMYGSDLPVGGDGTNSLLSAHTGMVNASMFDNLRKLKDGDEVFVEVMGEKLKYKVHGQKVVKPEQWQQVTYEKGKDKLTMVTCTPYGINTDRLLVNAERVPMDNPNEPADKWRPVLSWWMIVDLIVIALVLLLVGWREFGARRRKKKKQQLKNQGDKGHRPFGLNYLGRQG
ncbi:class C sortase [Corynebacterium auriscanis]|uniref:class C sortase n=1 Tax=Corynebacterium auriscanis TaxID=99807 RepID=UPI00068F6298|nr:class C sortase [Corynebacterium auriscanis]WJY72244.1 Sortase family protein [Corynebacterium auriscanis]